MSARATENPYYTTRCRHCEFALTVAGFEIPNLRALDGQAPTRLMEFHGKLQGHIQRCADDERRQIEQIERTARKRKKAGQPPAAPIDLSIFKHHFAQIAVANRILIAQSTGILNHFVTADPALAALQDGGRWELHQATRKFAFTDQMLLDRLQPLALPADVQHAIFALMSEVRDALEERGNYLPGQPGALDAVETGRPMNADA